MVSEKWGAGEGLGLCTSVWGGGLAAGSSTLTPETAVTAHLSAVKGTIADGSV